MPRPIEGQFDGVEYLRGKAGMVNTFRIIISSVQFSLNNNSRRRLLVNTVPNIYKNVLFWNRVQRFKARDDILFKLNFNNILEAIK